jgi:hypothetical protein
VIKTYAVACQACKGGYVDGQLCSTCDGAEKILIPETQSRARQRFFTLCAVLALVALVGYVVGGMVR